MSRYHKDWIKAYLRYANNTEAPARCHFWTGVSTIAGALGRKVWIDMGHFQWTPNFYIILVAPPGVVSKSTTINIGMKLLRQVPDVKFGPDSVTWQALIQSLAESHVEVPIGDMYYPMSCINIASSEFGTFLNPQDRDMVDVLVSLWDGQLGTWEKKTKTQGGDSVVNPWINVIACTTPAWIAGNFPDYMIGGGFVSRCVFVYADKKERFIAYPKKHQVEGFEQLQKELVHDLEVISQIKGEYVISEDAMKWGEEWYEKHWSEKPEHLSGEKFASYLARKQTHVHKLAIVLAASKRDKTLILREDLVQAEAFVTANEADMPKVFEEIGHTNESRQAAMVLDVVKHYKQLPKTRLAQLLYKSMGFRELEVAIQAAINAGYLSLVQRGNEILYVYRGGAG